MNVNLILRWNGDFALRAITSACAGNEKIRSCHIFQCLCLFLCSLAWQFISTCCKLNPELSKGYVRNTPCYHMFVFHLRDPPPPHIITFRASWDSRFEEFTPAHRRLSAPHEARLTWLTHKVLNSPQTQTAAAHTSLPTPWIIKQ